jgi:hypothetical protein
MTQLLEDQQLLHREKDDERRRRRTAEQRQASLLSEVERERQSVKRQEERIAELEGANAATQLAAREEARSRLREVAVSVELQKRLAALQVEVDECRQPSRLPGICGRQSPGERPAGRAGPF